MATLVCLDSIAALQLFALGGFELAHAAVGAFPSDSALQLSACNLIRARCADDVGRTAAADGVGDDSLQGHGFGGQAQLLGGDTWRSMGSAFGSALGSRTSVDFDMSGWTGGSGPVPSALTTLLCTLCYQHGLGLGQLRVSTRVGAHLPFFLFPPEPRLSSFRAKL